MATSTNRDWLIPPALLLLSAVPIAAGTFRLMQLSGGTPITEANARFFSAPLPVIIHIISVTLFSVLGAFQFVGPIRTRWPMWHRNAGKLLVLAGLASALSGLWMTQFYANPPGDGIVLYYIRLVVGAGMTLSIIFGWSAILRGDVTTHSAWMIRAYALGLGAGTQVFTHLPFILMHIKWDEPLRAFLMGAGWGINWLFAEWIIRGRKRAANR